MTFNSDLIQKSGSINPKKHTYRFVSEKGIEFILPCLSDSGSARSLISQDLLEMKDIKYYQTTQNEHLYDPAGRDIHISRTVMLHATFKDNSIYVDALVSPYISQEIIVSCHDSKRINAISIGEDDWPSPIAIRNSVILALSKGKPPDINLRKEEIQDKN